MPDAPALKVDQRVEGYDALTRGVALVDRSRVGRLRLTGDDALDLLDRLSTNALAELAVGSGVPTVLTSNKGRILDLLLVLRHDDHLLVLTGAGNQGKVAEWIDFYTIVEDVAVQDATGDTAMIGVAGPEAGRFLDGATGVDCSSLGKNESAPARLGDVDTLIVRTDFLRLPSYDLIVPSHSGDQVKAGLLDAGQSAHLTPVDAEASEAVRVERGVPGFGKELTEEFNPLEAGLLGLISFTKGCYVGQEVVTRLNTYKKVQKRLMSLRWEGETDPDTGAKLLLDGKQVGVVTSIARSPSSQRGVGLGYVRMALAEAGAVLVAQSGEGEVAVELAEPAVTP